jgi:hypothetical protein
MIEHTQSSTYPGNCWQTSVACLLDVDPIKLPPQPHYDYRIPGEEEKDDTFGPSFGNALGLYLRRHHGLFYLEIDASSAKDVLIPIGYHMLTGRTVRSHVNRGMRHVVVGYRGRMIWDPHPSRAGLTDKVRLATLIPFPPEYAEYWDRRPDPCECPECGPVRPVPPENATWR